MGIAEAKRILEDALHSDDFQPQYSQRQYMTGPALRGCLERALGELGKAERVRDSGEAGLEDRIASLRAELEAARACIRDAIDHEATEAGWWGKKHRKAIDAAREVEAEIASLRAELEAARAALETVQPRREYELSWIDTILFEKWERAREGK